MTSPEPVPENVVPKDAIMDSVTRYIQEMERAVGVMREEAITNRVLRIDQLAIVESRVARINKLLRVTVRYK